MQPNYYGYNYNPTAVNPYQYGMYQGQAAQPTYQPPQPVRVTQLPWVQGEAAAMAYQLSPGEKAIFMDADRPVLYAREADATGKPLPMKTYNLVEVKTEEPSQADMSQYVKAEALEEMISQIVEEQLNRRVSEMTFKPAPKTKKNTEE